MKPKKINTVKGGLSVIIVLAINIIICVAIAIIMLPSMESLGIFCLALIIALIMISYINQKWVNYLYLDDSKIRHKNVEYIWENVCITLSCEAHGKQILPYLYFDNHYLTEEEIKSKDTKRKGFYILVDPKRINYIFQFYKKKIKFLNKIYYPKALKDFVEKNEHSFF